MERCRLLSHLCVLALLGGMGLPAAHAEVLAAGPIQAALVAMQEGRRPLKDLVVTYDDQHPRHGGLALTIRGDGKVRQWAAAVPAGRPKTAVSPADLQALVELLIRLQAWQQPRPSREPKIDETRARLEIEIGPHKSQIWEWYNDLDRNQHLVLIRELMKKIAWRPGGTAGRGPGAR